MPKPPKRPADMMQLAKMVGELATVEPRTSDADPLPTTFQERAAKGGKARAKSLTRKERAIIARKGGRASSRKRSR